MSSMVQLEAPQDMPGGFVFDAEVEGKEFSVAVPESGVQKGQIIEVPYPEDTPPDTTQDAKAVKTVKENELPTGKWRHGLFDCCKTVATTRFWMAFCCECVVLGQLLQRFKLNALGQPGNYENTCMIVGGGGVTLYILGYLLSYVHGIGGYIWILMAIWMVAIGSFLRLRVRKKYNILATCCGDGWDDCCCMWWCGCCNAIQISRQTHNESKYPYVYFETTGLAPEAPNVVY